MSVTSKMKNWLRRSSLAKHRTRRRVSRLFGERRWASFETLEPRQLLAADFVYEVGAVHNLRLIQVGEDLQLRDRLDDSVLKTARAVETNQVHITGSDSADTLEIDASAAAPATTI